MIKIEKRALIQKPPSLLFTETEKINLNPALTTKYQQYPCQGHISNFFFIFQAFKASSKRTIMSFIIKSHLNEALRLSVGTELVHHIETGARK